ncbi:hypothetical protein AVEN_229595-1 [Araneus ventricosus]|uniref:Uncharacterized protein n=1 Tax=Araneus ventricosus TaxID=182803 RepID=A0A4Y2DBY7_ARAVE|nr:hypothetical protein AVEN_229595-1 [Araneus ventricosus]
MHDRKCYPYEIHDTRGCRNDKPTTGVIWRYFTLEQFVQVHTHALKTLAIHSYARFTTEADGTMNSFGNTRICAAAMEILATKLAAEPVGVIMLTSVEFSRSYKSFGTVLNRLVMWCTSAQVPPQIQ